jgi:1-acyl-sn-glycerol-3-phosphate acyltransferase
MKTLLGILRFLAGILVSFLLAGVAIITLPIDRRRGRFFHALAVLWAKTVLRICGIRLTVRGSENLRRGQTYVYVANHASLLDIPCTLAGVPDRIRIVYKKELEAIPLFGWQLKWGNYIPIERANRSGAMRSLEEAARKIREGASVLLYAEGTRTTDGKLRAFKRGAFNLALRSGVPVIPLTINGTFHIIGRGSMVIHPARAELILGEPIPVSGSGKEAELGLMAEVDAAIRKFYVEQ